MNVAGPTDRPAAGVLVPAGTWHTVLALDDDAILFETKAGPFDPAAPKEPAPWGRVGSGLEFAHLRAARPNSRLPALLHGRGACCAAIPAMSFM